jgi:hypothetical protein
VSEQVSELGEDGDDESPRVVSPLQKRQSSRRSQLSHRGSYRRRISGLREDDSDDAEDLQLSDDATGRRRWGVA